MKFKQCVAWNVDGKFYHSIPNAVDALTDHIAARINLAVYYRRRNNRPITPGYYLPGGFYDLWLCRLRRRVAAIVHTQYNKRLK